MGGRKALETTIPPMRGFNSARTSKAHEIKGHTQLAADQVIRDVLLSAAVMSATRYNGPRSDPG